MALCPNCKTDLNAHAQIDGPNDTPAIGDIGLCGSCGCCVVYGTENAFGVLRRPHRGEFDDLTDFQLAILYDTQRRIAIRNIVQSN